MDSETGEFVSSRLKNTIDDLSEEEASSIAQESYSSGLSVDPQSSQSSRRPERRTRVRRRAQFVQVLSPAKILTSVIGQILYQVPHGSAILERALYHLGSQSHIAKQVLLSSELSTEEDLPHLWSLLSATIQQLPIHEIVLAVDELEKIPHKSRLEFVTQLKHLWISVCRSSKILRIFAASRPDKDLSELLADLPLIDERAELNGKPFCLSSYPPNTSCRMSQVTSLQGASCTA